MDLCFISTKQGMQSTCKAQHTTSLQRQPTKLCAADTGQKSTCFDELASTWHACTLAMMCNLQCTQRVSRFLRLTCSMATCSFNSTISAESLRSCSSACRKSKQGLGYWRKLRIPCCWNPRSLGRHTLVCDMLTWCHCGHVLNKHPVLLRLNRYIYEQPETTWTQHKAGTACCMQNFLRESLAFTYLKTASGAQF